MNATPTTFEQERAEHHTAMAVLAQTNAETYRTYLEWAEDPAQRRWALAKAIAAELEATAEADYATALRERVPA